jgi:hypothetical protein
LTAKKGIAFSFYVDNIKKVELLRLECDRPGGNGENRYFPLIQWLGEDLAPRKSSRNGRKASFRGSGLL